MTPPEQKAKQLIDKFMHLFSVHFAHSIAPYEAAECAKLYVEDLIDSGILEPQLKRHYINGDAPNINQLEYWMQVKKELKKY